MCHKLKNGSQPGVPQHYIKCREDGSRAGLYWGGDAGGRRPPWRQKSGQRPPWRGLKGTRGDAVNTQIW